MNQQELLAAAEVMMRAGCGEVVEIHTTNGWVAVDSTNWNWGFTDHRILSFPPAPCGQSWHNPTGLTATQVGVHEGWRLLLQTEANVADKDALKCEFYAGNFQKWIASGEKSKLAGTYRTKSPLPVATQPSVTNQTEESWMKENCKKAFPNSWNMTILEIWQAGWEADQKQNKTNQ